MHRYNPSLRGMVKVNCIANPAIEWIFESRDQFKAAPAVAGDYCVVGNTTGIIFSHLANMLNFITLSL